MEVPDYHIFHWKHTERHAQACKQFTPATRWAWSACSDMSSHAHIMAMAAMFRISALMLQKLLLLGPDMKHYPMKMC